MELVSGYLRYLIFCLFWTLLPTLEALVRGIKNTKTSMQTPTFELSTAFVTLPPYFYAL